MSIKEFLVVLAASLILTTVGVIFFFEPISKGDDTILELPPAVGLVYIVLCALIYYWGYRETRNCFKAATIVVIPQAVLILDLMLRGDRGPITTAAGITLLIVTWYSTAFIHQRIFVTRP